MVPLYNFGLHEDTKRIWEKWWRLFTSWLLGLLFAFCKVYYLSFQWRSVRFLFPSGLPAKWKLNNRNNWKSNNSITSNINDDKNVNNGNEDKSYD